ncbi:PIEZO2 [Cordylochernes scorpioides]|uniref:PIEZO2 n=1 Tax=Cordylochernes scorpioides TaxID=51811 RepID=A0ABY6KEX4_9ARAC|nr:PIEZO2 [Cordylochernes scorpioides]
MKSDYLPSITIRHDLLYLVLYRFILPAGLFAATGIMFWVSAAIFRYNLLSFVYLLFFLVYPFIPPPQPFFTHGEKSTTLGIVFYHLGFVSINRTLSWTQGLRLMGIDMMMSLLVAITHSASCAATHSKKQKEPTGETPKVWFSSKSISLSFLLYLGEFVYLVLLVAAGILSPSLLSALYFVTFLAQSTWLACCQPIGNCYLISRFVVVIMAGFHISLLYIYQFSLINETVKPEDLVTRLVGLKVFVRFYPCHHDPNLWFQELTWPHFLVPPTIALLYLQSVILNRCRSSILLELVKKPQATSVKVSPSDSSTLPPTKIKDPFLAFLRSLVTPCIFMATLITMMAWSILYHSLMAFVFLLLSCIIWITPDSRKSYLRISPFIVAYAHLMLLIHFVFCLEIHDLVPVPNGLGLTMFDPMDSAEEYLLLDFVIKISFTIMFLLALWTYMLKKRKMIHSALSTSDMYSLRSTLKNKERIETFQMWTWRKLPRVPRTYKRTQLESQIYKQRLTYIRHLMITNGLEKML